MSSTTPVANETKPTPLAPESAPEFRAAQSALATTLAATPSNTPATGPAILRARRDERAEKARKAEIEQSSLQHLAATLGSLAANRNIEALSWRIEGGFPMNVADAGGDTPLMRAARAGCAQTVRLLLPFSDPLATNDKGESALRHAAFRVGREAFCELLPVSDPMQLDRQDRSAWTSAAIKGDVAALRALLDLGDRGFLAPDGKKRIALLELVSWKSATPPPASVDLLAEMIARMSPADFASLERAGHSPLVRAACQGNLPAARLFIPFCDFRAADANGVGVLDGALCGHGVPGALAFFLAAAPVALRADWAERFLRRFLTPILNTQATQARQSLAASISPQVVRHFDTLALLSDEELAPCESWLSLAVDVFGLEQMPRCAARAEARVLAEIAAAARGSISELEGAQSGGAGFTPRRI